MQLAELFYLYVLLLEPMYRSIINSCFAWLCCANFWNLDFVGGTAATSSKLHEDEDDDELKYNMFDQLVLHCDLSRWLEECFKTLSLVLLISVLWQFSAIDFVSCDIAVYWFCLTQYYFSSLGMDNLILLSLALIKNIALLFQAIVILGFSYIYGSICGCTAFETMNLFNTSILSKLLKGTSCFISCVCTSICNCNMVKNNTFVLK